MAMGEPGAVFASDDGGAVLYLYSVSGECIAVPGGMLIIFWFAGNQITGAGQNYAIQSDNCRIRAVLGHSGGYGRGEIVTGVESQPGMMCVSGDKAIAWQRGRARMLNMVLSHVVTYILVTAPVSSICHVVVVRGFARALRLVVDQG